MAGSAEFDLLRGYLQERSYQWRRGNDCLWVINASVKLGDSLPAACAAWAREQSSVDSLLEVRILNLAVDEAMFVALEKELARCGPGVVMSLQGTIEIHIQYVLRVIGIEPAFVVLNPFEGEGVNIVALQRLVTRRGRKSELLVRLDGASYGHLAESVPQRRFDTVLGRTLWDEADRRNGHGHVAVLYRASLRRSGYPYVYEIPVFAGGDWPSKSRWLFATRSPAAVALMSELLCRREREQSGATEVDLSELRKAIERFGASIGHASTTQIVHSVSPELFGKFCKSEYRAAIRTLVEAGAIVRSSDMGIKDSEWLSFSPTHSAVACR
jgi:hypothetical protein